jgi:exopolyphosphatase/guanosine-5'-triphosphate,3'-diphosphate pyrophosphatase
MIKINKYAAIDIGSNAVRLLISSVISKKNEIIRVKKISLVRVPIRLGADSFKKNKIKKENIRRLSDAILAFKLLMKVHRITKYKICATSALRSANNIDTIKKSVFKKSELILDVISGKEEASIIADTFFASNYLDNKTYLFVDVGGGSTELSLIFKGNIIASKSFKIGTIRFINDLIDENIMNEYKTWIIENTKEFSDIILIGTGGNINKILKESKKSNEEIISYTFIEKFYKKITSLSYNQRITKLGFNPDRSDVIVPATKIFLKTMEYANSKEIIAPRIGLADGIIRKLNNSLSYGYDFIK